VKILFLRS